MAEGESGGGADATTAAWFAFFNEIGIIHQLSRAVFEARLPKGVTVAQFSVLNHLVRVRDGQTPLNLAAAFQVPKTTMTHILAGLEERELVATRPNLQDRRSKQVWLTEAGRDFREGAIGCLSGDIAALAEKADTARIAAVTPVLADIRRLLDESR